MPREADMPYTYQLARWYGSFRGSDGDLIHQAARRWHPAIFRELEGWRNALEVAVLCCLNDLHVAEGSAGEQIIAQFRAHPLGRPFSRSEVKSLIDGSAANLAAIRVLDNQYRENLYVAALRIAALVARDAASKAAAEGWRPDVEARTPAEHLHWYLKLVELRHWYQPPIPAHTPESLGQVRPGPSAQDAPAAASGGHAGPAEQADTGAQAARPASRSAETERREDAQTVIARITRNVDPETARWLITINHVSKAFTCGPAYTLYRFDREEKPLDLLAAQVGLLEENFGSLLEGVFRDVSRKRIGNRRRYERGTRGLRTSIDADVLHDLWLDFKRHSHDKSVPAPSEIPHGLR